MFFVRFFGPCPFNSEGPPHQGTVLCLTFYSAWTFNCWRCAGMLSFSTTFNLLKRVHLALWPVMCISAEGRIRMIGRSSVRSCSSVSRLLQLPPFHQDGARLWDRRQLQFPHYSVAKRSHTRKIQKFPPAETKALPRDAAEERIA